MPPMLSKFYELSAYLNSLLDNDPALAVKKAREIDLDTPERPNMMSLRLAILVDGGALFQQQDAIEELLELLRELNGLFPIAGITHNPPPPFVFNRALHSKPSEREAFGCWFALRTAPHPRGIATRCRLSPRRSMSGCVAASRRSRRAVPSLLA